MENTTIELPGMTINVDQMTSQELSSLVKALVDVLPPEYAARLVREWREKRGLAKEELE